MRRLTTALLLSTAALLTASAPLQVDKYVIDTGESHIGFSARHLMVSTVKGSFRTYAGEINIDDKDITKSSAKVSIDVASLSTDNDRRDNHLKSDDFLNAAQYPHITFESTRVEKKGAQLLLVGNLTIRDVTKQVSIPFELTGPINQRNRKTIGIDGTITINRFDYGLKYNRIMESVQVVAPEVKIELSIAANTVPPAAPAQ